MGTFEQIATAHLRLIDKLVRAAEVDVEAAKLARQEALRRLHNLQELEREARAIFRQTMGNDADV